MFLSRRSMPERWLHYGVARRPKTVTPEVLRRSLRGTKASAHRHYSAMNGRNQTRLRGSLFEIDKGRAAPASNGCQTMNPPPSTLVPS
jgi:hypothetical protein